MTSLLDVPYDVVGVILEFCEHCKELICVHPKLWEFFHHRHIIIRPVDAIPSLPTLLQIGTNVNNDIRTLNIAKTFQNSKRYRVLPELKDLFVFISLLHSLKNLELNVSYMDIPVPFEHLIIPTVENLTLTCNSFWEIGGSRVSTGGIQAVLSSAASLRCLNISFKSTKANHTDFLLAIPNPDKLNSLELDCSWNSLHTIDGLERFTNLQQLKLELEGNDRFTWDSLVFPNSLRSLSLNATGPNRFSNLEKQLPTHNLTSLSIHGASGHWVPLSLLVQLKNVKHVTLAHVTWHIPNDTNDQGTTPDRTQQEESLPPLLLQELKRQPTKIERLRFSPGGVHFPKFRMILEHFTSLRELELDMHGRHMPESALDLSTLPASIDRLIVNGMQSCYCVGLPSSLISATLSYNNAPNMVDKMRTPLHTLSFSLPPQLHLLLWGSKLNNSGVEWLCLRFLVGRVFTTLHLELGQNSLDDGCIPFLRTLWDVPDLHLGLTCNHFTVGGLHQLRKCLSTAVIDTDGNRPREQRYQPAAPEGWAPQPPEKPKKQKPPKWWQPAYWRRSEA